MSSTNLTDFGSDSWCQNLMVIGSLVAGALLAAAGCAAAGLDASAGLAGAAVGAGAAAGEQAAASAVAAVAAAAIRSCLRVIRVRDSGCERLSLDTMVTSTSRYDK